MAGGKVNIDDDVKAVLQSAIVDGFQLKIVTQLDRKLYERTNKVLQALGGKWERKANAHVFPLPIPEILGEALGNGYAVDDKKRRNQFFTPPEIAERMIRLANIQPGHRILEPQAGGGNIIRKIYEVPESDRCAIVAVEIDHILCETLRTLQNVEVVEGDFLSQTGELGKFDRILMNPPFERGADVKHIQHARHFLKHRGRLVSLCANGPLQRGTFMEDAESWLDLPSGSFKEEGTNVNSAMVVLAA